MEGFVKLTKESLIDLISKSREVIAAKDLDQYKEMVKQFRFLKMKYVDHAYYSGAPFWYSYDKALLLHLKDLELLTKRDDEINISLLSYTHLVKLANGDKNTNPIYILNY